MFQPINQVPCQLPQSNNNYGTSFPAILLDLNHIYIKSYEHLTFFEILIFLHTKRFAEINFTEGEWISVISGKSDFF